MMGGYGQPPVITWRKSFFFVFSVMTTEYGAVMELIYNWRSN